jgi:23S rRNA maturation-related 3'-5' exoribonuclease YhaM
MSTATQTHELITHQNIGDAFSGVYYVEQAYVKLTVQNKEYTDMVLRDRSGSRGVKFWGTVEVGKGDFAFISANVQDYQGTPSIVAKNVQKEDAPADLSNYISAYDDAADHDERFDAIREELAKLDKAIGNDTCGMLIDEVFRSSAFYARFIAAPGSDSAHYGRQGGLLANTVRVTDAALAVAPKYKLTDQEKAILVAAGILHRLGAVDAFGFIDCMPQATSRGLLVGVDNLTMTRLAAAMRRLATSAKANNKTIDQDLLVRILHCISSYSEVIKPMTKEALVLAAASRSDREIVEAVEFIENDAPNGDQFTAFDPNLGRRYFKG